MADQPERLKTIPIDQLRPIPDNTKLFKEKIEPLLDQIYDICLKHDIPFVGCCQISQSETMSLHVLEGMQVSELIHNMGMLTSGYIPVIVVPQPQQSLGIPNPFEPPPPTKKDEKPS